MNEMLPKKKNNMDERFILFIHIILLGKNQLVNNCFFCNLFIFPRTDLYIHDSINIMFQCTKVTM